ncbi:MAG: RNA polymerase sigma-70 factor [Bacteroidetes bacterium]|nr:RNA polymerase sigma-70 factor [Bacteroidota bacterium]
MSSPETEQYRQFQTVFRTYYNQLCNYALTFTKDEDVCEDIVQDLFIKVWEQRRGLLKEASIRYYLFTAVRNNCISWLRKEKQQGTVRWDSQENVAVAPDYPEETAGGEKDDRRLLEQAIAQLPPKCKEVFLLSRFGKLSYREIATSLGISEKTVENQLGKALKTLRAFLKESRVGLTLIISWIFS